MRVRAVDVSKRSQVLHQFDEAAQILVNHNTHSAILNAARSICDRREKRMRYIDVFNPVNP
jgi:hypothetical protein